MGYYTRYKLQVIPEDSTQLVKDAIAAAAGYNSFSERTTWHEHDQHCQLVSKANEYMILILDGEGEEAGDIWRKAWRNGELILNWEASIKPPTVPQELIDFVSRNSRVAKIAKLEAELAELKKLG